MHMKEIIPVDILAFGAHPDDVELGCGGTLAKLKKLGYRTGIVDLSEGELGSRGTVKQRYEESAAAAELLQLDFRSNLKIPDGLIEIFDPSSKINCNTLDDGRFMSYLRSLIMSKVFCFS